MRTQAMKTTLCKYAFAGAVTVACLLLSRSPALAADAKDAAKAAGDGKAAPAASTNKAPWRVEIAKSVFVDDRNRKEFKDPFFPVTDRRLTDAERKEIEIKRKAEEARIAKEKADAEAAAIAAAIAAAGGKTTPGTNTDTVKRLVPAKWFTGFSVIGTLGTASNKIAIVSVGVDSYNFRQGKTLEVITSKGPMKVTCVKISAESVELRMAGEDEPAVLQLP